MRRSGRRTALSLCAAVVALSLAACERQGNHESMPPVADSDKAGELIRVPAPVDLRAIDSLSDLASAADATLWGKGPRTTTLCLRSHRCSSRLAQRIADLELVSSLGFVDVECENHRESFSASVGAPASPVPVTGWSRLLRIEISGTVIAMRDVNCSAERLTSFVTNNQAVLADHGFSAVRCGHYQVDLVY